jgi:hypothetical protein
MVQIQRQEDDAPIAAQQRVDLHVLVGCRGQGQGLTDSDVRAQQGQLSVDAPDAGLKLRVLRLRMAADGLGSIV